MLKSEHNSGYVRRLILSAAAHVFGRGKASPVYDHGKWWVRVDEGGETRTYSVVDAKYGINDTEIDFEEV